MNKAINLEGLPKAFIQLLLHQLNSAAIHLPAWAPGRHFLERGGEGALFLCTAVEHPKPISFQLQSCFLSFFLRQGARLRLFWTTVSCPLEAQVTDFKTEILDAQVFLLMKTYIANFLSEVMPPEVTCHCLFSGNHFFPCFPCHAFYHFLQSLCISGSHDARGILHEFLLAPADLLVNRASIFGIFFSIYPLLKGIILHSSKITVTLTISSVVWFFLF